MATDIGIIDMLQRVSRLLNGLTGGSFDEMFCSRIWRSCNGDCLLVDLIDALMFRIYGEDQHCRNCALYEFLRTAPPEPDDIDYGW